MGSVRGGPIWHHVAPRVRADARPRAVERDIVVVAAPVAAARTVGMFLVGLPPTFGLPLVLLLGGARSDDRGALVSLRAHCVLPLRLVDDGDGILPGHVHLAPADYHLLVENDRFALSMAAPVNGARPSIDVLFDSVADAFGDRAVCVRLGHDRGGDGRDGATKVRDCGGLVIVEDPTTAAVDETAPRDEGPPDATATVLHLSEIASFLSRLGTMEVT